MEDNAIDFTRRLLENRFNYYKIDIRKYFSENYKMDEIYELFLELP